jgi:MinD superfamily P-loop ATPase
MVQALGVKCGVVINQCDIGDGGVRDYCRSKGLKVLAEIPHDRKVAEAYSRGLTAYRMGEGYRRIFRNLLKALGDQAKWNS